MLIACVSVVMAPLCVLSAHAQATVVIEAENSDFGRHLTDGRGISVYLFERDRRPADQGASNKSACADECLLLFPPIPADRVPVAGDGVNAGLIGSVLRKDGKLQATYNGWPLYYFAEDFVPGDINGHQFEEFGGGWYLVTPTGREFGGKPALGIANRTSENCDCHETYLPTITDTSARPPRTLALVK